ncbi:MAG: hypothetical protein UV58_C0006G0022 [Candidatus Wolfebacteria bacterium GW2011_GWC1_43_10]|uniref:Uncharacterized protein n=2 Tax=Candidatus Wolfeibacteriota TaxID=1752735 RepID=A0A0G1F797_9BACT|nr:MAG: hypothetical protein UV58_C0006G0022 [Candidatus Wolfebacteria bacterium GW2011_GWC1_43_10]KKT22928.1 MAG: hypothetical protein UW08_C0002G0057 [Parcubacteria group bacterium GW2011_GWB1_43_8b]OGM89959.1 MAG: hypothetical protein A2108_02290 [Candidatus Wolfebacteria bacterium GWA1_42_9]
MKDLCIVLVVLLALSFSFSYAWKVRKGQIAPTLSMWIIFFASTTLSIITYAISENKDFRSGILNLVDVLQTGLAFGAVLIWRERKIILTSFEKKYLAGFGAIVIYGVVSGDAFSSNLFAQILISSGYFPTIRKMVEERRNTESFVPWRFAIAAGTVGLYPAVVDGNLLAAVYAVRTIVLVSGMMVLMAYYEYIYKPKNA